jgi:O-antigen/teichoic acid export membrane protein
VIPDLARLRLAFSLLRLRPFDTSTELGRSNERYRRILLTTVSGLALRGFGTILSLVTFPLVLAHLGKERFGLWSTINMLVAWATLFDFGMANGLVNLVARAHGREDPEGARRAVSTAAAALSGIALLLGLTLAVAAPLVPWGSFLASRGVVGETVVVWSVVGAFGLFIAAIPLSAVGQVFAGYQRTYVANVFSLGGAIAGFGLLLTALHADASLPWIIVASGIGPLLAATASLAWILGRGMPWLRFRWSALSRDALRALLVRSAPLFLFQIGALAVNETQPILLAHRTDLATVAEYAILLRIYLLLMSLIQTSTASVAPTLREAYERGDVRWVTAAFRQFVRLRLLLASGGVAVLLLFGNVLLRLWLRRSDVQFPLAVWAALAVLMLSATWVTAHTDILAIMDYLWPQVALVMLNGAVVIGLTYALAPRLGVLGVIIASGATTVTTLSWLVPRMVASLLRGETAAARQR